MVIQANLAHAHAERIFQRGLDLRMQRIGVLGGTIWMHAHEVPHGKRRTVLRRAIDRRLKPRGKRAGVRSLFTAIGYGIVQGNQRANASLVCAGENVRHAFVLPPKRPQMGMRVVKRA